MGQQDPNPLSDPCSRLESLPVEIIQLIFLHCLEVNLPRASPRLSYALSIRTPARARDSSRRTFAAAIGLLGVVLGGTTEASDYASDLSVVYLSAAQAYVLHTIRRKCAGLVFHEDDMALLENLEARFEDLGGCDWAVNGRRGKGDLVFHAQLDSNASSRIDRKVAIWFHFGAVQIREPHDIYYENDLFRLPCALAIRPGRIPDKVLRSPWSDSQFEFLQLLSADFYLDEDEVCPERSSEITYRLIRKRMIEPFRRLLGMSFRAANCRVPARWPLQPSHYSLVRRYASGSGDPFAMTILHDRWDDVPADAKEDLLRYIEPEGTS
ncbi:uncharacterized protein N7511_006036 [Penicillium nucicola]|uniref:uncharacterized protein n=1 Tax=Penicillium nucicola TaxID=1850975 RepID=UPI0025457A9F|nr:uncharacterized protein N7511_006036 [Penicillium nucicola]KAJ5757342.1 hypothetical protein N7511_006036 [Penicillium nucicola]